MNPRQYAAAYAALVKSLGMGENDKVIESHAGPQSNTYAWMNAAGYLMYPDSGLPNLWMDRNIHVYPMQHGYQPYSIYSGASTSAWQVLTEEPDDGKDATDKKKIGSEGDDTGTEGKKGEEEDEAYTDIMDCNKDVEMNEEEKRICQEEKQNMKKKLKEVEKDKDTKIEEIKRGVCDPDADICKKECLAAAKKALQVAEIEAKKKYKEAMKEYKVLEKKHKRQVEINDAQSKRRVKAVERDSEIAKERIKHREKLYKECVKTFKRVEKEALKQVIKIEQEEMRKAKIADTEAKKADTQAKKAEEEARKLAEKEARKEARRIAQERKEYEERAKQEEEELEAAMKRRLDMGTIRDLMEERMRLRTLMNNSLDFMGANTVEPVINPSIALYVDRGRKRREMMANDIMNSSRYDDDTVNSPRYDAWHDSCIKCCSPNGPEVILPSCGPNVCKNAMCKENVRMSEESDEEEEKEETDSSDSVTDEDGKEEAEGGKKKRKKKEQTPYFDRLDLLGYDVIRMYPAEVVGACKRDPMVVYGPKRKPTVRDKRRKHVIGRDMFGMQHHRRRSVRNTLLRLPHECPFCIMADKQRDNPRWRYQ